MNAECNGCRMRRRLNDQYLCYWCVQSEKLMEKQIGENALRQSDTLTFSQVDTEW